MEKFRAGLKDYIGVIRYIEDDEKGILYGIPREKYGTRSDFAFVIQGLSSQLIITMLGKEWLLKRLTYSLDKKSQEICKIMRTGWPNTERNYLLVIVLKTKCNKLSGNKSDL